MKDLRTDNPRDETAKELIAFTNEFIKAPAGTKVALGFVKIDDEWGLSIQLGEKYLGLPMKAALGFRDVVERHPYRHPRMHDLAAMLNNGIAELDRHNMETTGDKVRHVKAAKQTRKHSCHWPGCELQVPPAMWGCSRHWYMLPRRLRERVWATYKSGQEISMTPSPAYLAVADEVRIWIIENGKEGA